jgi:hypothetical protein
MTNKKPPSQIRRVAKGMDIIVMSLFALGVVVVIVLFIYVLSNEFVKTP